MRLRWDGIIARLSYRFNFLAIRDVANPTGPAFMRGFVLWRIQMAKKPKLLADLFHDTLKDVYFVEKKTLTTLPKMAKAARSKDLSLIHISEPTRLGMISYAV